MHVDDPTRVVQGAEVAGIRLISPSSNGAAALLPSAANATSRGFGIIRFGSPWTRSNTTFDSTSLSITNRWPKKRNTRSSGAPPPFGGTKRIRLAMR